MNIKEFRERAANRYRLKFLNKSYGGLPWKDWYKLANKTNEINYGCHFHNDGTCTHQRNRKDRGFSPNEMCWCQWCANDVGYLDFIQNDPEVISIIARYFEAKVGFWRKDKGCILPRQYRSATCLGYRCPDSNKVAINGNAAILLALLSSIRLGTLSDKEIYALGKVLIDIDT